MAANPIDIYRRQIERELQAGNATEHTHRPALKDLIESLEAGVTATNEPKRVECGAPDFIVSRKSVHGPMTLGYVEAKDVGKDLGEIEHSDQIKRYRSALPNLILTDYLEFRWYVAGEHRQTARLARVGKGAKLVPEREGPESVSELLAAFLAHQAPSINTPKELALRMARLTHLIRDIIQASFEKDQASATVRDLHKAFEKVLIPELPVPQFADMFSQTLAYGLFAARMNHRGPRGSFKRLGAAAEIPKTNPFLRQLFETITGTALDDEPFVGFVDDLAQLLADTDIDAVLADFGKRTARQDPVVHFYETFLAAYDPKLRESRGVYYTPEPVVSYIVRSVDALLKNRFGCAGGLADTATVEYEREGVAPVSSPASGDGDIAATKAHGGQVTSGHPRPPLQKVTSPRVLILDPACGTGTFLYSVVDHIRAEFVKQGNAGMWSGYVRNHLLPRLFGFELLMAPYAVAHFKLGMQLAGYDLDTAQRAKWAYDFSGDERLGVFLTNTLEEAEIRADTLFGPLRVISQEANAAAKIKRELPILAVIGNPPYSNFGQMNNTEWITNLMKDWKPPAEKKWNPDDFMKFMRWAVWRIEQTGTGILAFITNNTYIDGITRGRMRECLLESFDDIYILDLHGSSMKEELCPDGAKDENVFDIRQGVGIGIFVKKTRNSEPSKVHHAELWGLRETKYAQLFELDIESTQWQELKPQSDHFFFVPRDFSLEPEYLTYKTLDGEAFDQCNAGIQTKRDRLAYHLSAGELQAVLQNIETLSASDLTEKYELPPDGRDWTVEWAKKDVLSGQGETIRVLYRPFDHRFTFYTGRTKGLIAYPRFPLMASALKENLLFLTIRNARRGNIDNFFVANTAVDKDAVSPFDNATFFPLYIYPVGGPERKRQAELEVQSSHWPAGKGGRTPNLNPEFVADLEKRLGLKFVPERSAAVTAAFSEDAGKMPALPELTIRSRGHLPHWERQAATYFITFRLADSLPQSAMESIEFERKDIVKTAGQGNRELTAVEQERLDKLFSERVEQYLDSGQGACHLAQPHIAELVAEALRHFDGTRYRLLAWCLMPNHVHVVFQPLSGHRLADILHSWKSFTAKQANNALKRTGEFWQREYYDHLVRDEQDLDRIFNYVSENPTRAGLVDWKWVWRSAADVAPASGRPSSQRDAGATTFGPEDVFNYIYAVFHSPTYRTRYAEFLKSDFPRVPLTSDLKLFRSLCGLGGELVALHLLESPKLEKPIARFPIKGPNLVEKGFPKYVAPGEPDPVSVEAALRRQKDGGVNPPLQSQKNGGPQDKTWGPRNPPLRLKEGRVYINKSAVAPVSSPASSIKSPMPSSPPSAPSPVGSRRGDALQGQYFEGVPPEVWNFHIGGYQVCEKWLKDRRGRTLTYDDLEHYRKVVTALSETIRLMAEIDAAIPKWPIE